MGGWEIYCAICGGTFFSNVDMDPEGTDEYSYRYEILKDSNLDWLNKVCGLGINPEAAGDDKSFLTGVGRYWDYGSIIVPPNDDPNSPFKTGEGHPVAYYDHSGEGFPHVFPFHPICYQHVLRRCIQQARTGQIRRDVLFQIFEELNGGRYVRLDLDYGDPDPPAEQIWCPVNGQEVLVVNPVEIPQLATELSPIMELDHKVDPKNDTPRLDLFHKLPVELRQEIMKLLPAASILALKAASWSMHSTPCPVNSWKQRLIRELPWLWELHEIDLFQSQELERRASKFLMNLDERSRHEKDLLGLANRRRIWDVCEQIRGLYMEKL